MSYCGDIRLGDTIDFKFTTRQISGAPFTLAGSPVISAYVGNSTTEITAGITLSVDFDSRTGLNNVRVVATSGNGYATASNYQLVITTGTVNSVSVVSEVIAEFSIEARSALMPTTAARTADVDASGRVLLQPTQPGIAFGTVSMAGLTTNIVGNITGNLVGTLSTLTTYTGNTPQTGDSYARIGALGAGLTAVGDTAGTTTLLARVSAARAGYFDNLSAGAVMLASSYTAPDNTSITGIKAKTDSLTFTVAGQVDSNIQYVNDTQVKGVGTVADPWNPV